MAMMEGLPVISGVDKLADAIKKYSVECVILADSTMPTDVRKAVRGICGEMNVEVQDFAGFFQESRGAVTLRNLMEYAKGEVELVVNGKSQSFANGEQAVMSSPENMWLNPLLPMRIVWWWSCKRIFWCPTM